MRIVVIGTRGFPNVQGGVEKHCEQLSVHLIKLGCEVIVITRKPYVDTSIEEFKGVKLVALPAIRNKTLEAFIHTFFSIFFALKFKPDILHIQGIGPSVFTPLARLLGMKVVLTTHGPNYTHLKWGPIESRCLKLCEFIGMKTAHKIIAISKPIAMEIEHKYGRLATVIPNGTEIPELSLSDTVLRKYNLMKGKYVLTVGRFVPEKGFDDLIDVADKFLSLKMSYQEPPTIFETIRYHKEPIRAALPTKILATYDEPPNKWKLVIVGTADHENNYSRQLKEKARRNSDIILTGFLSGQPLKELYSHAGLFVLPSYQEGLPIALLEAMSHGVSCLASDIPANREFHLDDARYFKAGDKKLLAEKIQRFIKTSLSWEEKQNLRNSIASVYNWKSIAKSTLTVYKSLCKLAVIHFLWLIENFMTYQDLFSKPL